MKKIFKLMTLALAGAMFMVACDDTPAPYNPGGGEGGGDDTTKVDTLDITCAKAVELCTALADGASSTETYAITGYITDVYAKINNGQQSFWMSDNNDGQKVVQAYWANLPEGVEKFTAGSKVKITGKLLKYVKTDGTVVTEVKNADVEILENGGSQPGGAKGTGTEADPFNVAGVIAYINTLGADVNSEVEVYVKGKVSANSTSDATIATYGNMTFDMIDEGYATAIFKAFQVYGPGKQKFTSVSQIAVGDEVVVCGKVVNYKGNTPETVGKGQSYVVSINGKTELPGGGETPDQPGEAKGTGTEADPFNVAGVIAYINTLGADVNSEVEVYVKGKVSANSTSDATIATYGNMTFDMIDEGYATAIFKAFQVYGPGKQKFTSVSQIAVGDEVVVCGKVVNYKGNTPETVGKGQSYVVSINGKTELPGGGETPDTPGEGLGEVSGNTITLAASAARLDNAAEANTLTLKDGTTLVFEAGSNQNAPKFYTTGSSIRMYPNNTLTVKATKKIASIVITCGSSKGVVGNASGNIKAEPGEVNIGEDTVTIESVNANSTVITDTSTETKIQSQVYVKSIAITYAE